MNLKIGKKNFKVYVAESEEDKVKGLKGVKKLKKGHGLVMKWDDPQDTVITMKGMSMPIGVVFAKGGKVLEVKEALVDQPDIMIRDASDLVFEGNMKELTGIKPGDDISLVATKQNGGVIKFIEDDLPAEGGLHVLDEKGVVQANLKGNERVFSRIHTRKLFELAHAGKSKQLGKAMVNYINKQDTQEPQYVEEDES